MPLLPGEILNQRYRILSLLAEGAHGATYRAWDVKAEQDVAVKEYLDPSPETQRRFRAEARRLSQLEHPQLAPVLDHFALEEMGQYLVSKYVDGVDLGSLLAQYGRFPSDFIINWLQAVSQPLTYLHQHNQLHLNIKPVNIRLTPLGDIFLVDSGLPGLGVPAGLSGYAAPEQQSQREVTPASDIYSLGATLYTLLTGKIPPDGLRRQSGLSELIPAREVNPDVEPYLSLVAARAMSLRADARYEMVADFSKALARPIGHPAAAVEEPRRTPERTAVPGRPMTAAAPKLPIKSRRRMPARTVWALVAILLIALAAVGSLFLLNLNNEPEVTEAEATATLQSAVVAALTALAPTPSPLPAPTQAPTPTPQPIITQTGSRMLYMEGGVFRMGNDEGENNEKPSKLVHLDPYFIDETEVTNGQYAQCVAAGACQPPRSNLATYHDAYYGSSAYDDYPVIQVSWYDAQTFCEWRDARLPSEAEWEKAAGYDPVQSLKYHYPWGDVFDGTKLNYCDAGCRLDKRDASVNDGHQDTAPVGSYPDGRSPIGLYDMAGNVMEWVDDWYDPHAYADMTDTNPRGPLEGEFKTLRGGSWLSDKDEVTVTVRGSFDPTVARANLGFRCAVSSP
ncbi:MAG: SUMF1/EgtB/PvdO family nonheme iron enzyme [Ardenticatenaceae bacterium]|nr:SUMF1/EgtB/PvdO family nonheme iron enzyme [Ardenticatenaceae bacterium]MCB9444330.1 SUMF1/EgtB/PvdO family nonheme iron enzyme [Ardenticatenaceae bacterium]